MGFTPFARVRNITLDNLKQFLAMYPDLLYDTEWREIRDDLEGKMKGYARSYYQQACQLGLEDRSNEARFRFQKYLLSFDDENLKRYLIFWFKTYYAPNPFVKGSDEDPVALLYCAYAEKILEAENHTIDFDAVHEEICGDGKSADIEFNTFRSFGYPIECHTEETSHLLMVAPENIEALRNEVAFIKKEFPIDDTINKGTFFDRFSYRRFAKFWHIRNNQPAMVTRDGAVNYAVTGQRREQFMDWMKHSRFTVSSKDATIEKVSAYKESTIMNYINLLSQFPDGDDTINVLESTDTEKLDMLEKNSDKPYRAALSAYLLFLHHEQPQALLGESTADYKSKSSVQNAIAPHTKIEEPPVPPVDVTAPHLNQPLNWILFGAPGTGKSFDLMRAQEEHFPDAASFERVTFHPAYSYAQFFGTYKPVSEGKELYYQFVPGPFITMLLRALQHPDRNYLLIIEEINRADVAAVFGDVFQLLDRDADGRSVYDINIPEDLKRYLQDHHETQGDHEVYLYHGLLQGALRDGKLYIPANMYLWATMNSADQGVMPLDTAFKRRWTFTYVGVDITDKEKRKEAEFGPFELADGSYTWLQIRDRINARLKVIGGITEDRLLGPFFMQKVNIPDGDAEAFIRLFQSKVLMYLFQDIAQYADSEIFASHYVTYSDLCQAFRDKGMAIFPAGGAQEG